jgi:hypothetical protein
MAEDLTPTAGPGGAAVVQTSVPPASPPGQELIDEIGHGGMGVVYRARDAAIDRDCRTEGVLPRVEMGKTPPDNFTSRRVGIPSLALGSPETPSDDIPLHGCKDVVDLR